MTGGWDARILRAGRLAAEEGPVAPLLHFYARVLRHQQLIYDSFGARRPTGSIEADVNRIAVSGLPLVKAVAEDGPALLAAEARTLVDGSPSARAELLLAYWRARSDHDFFPKALLQPYAQWLADTGAAPIATDAPGADNRCPCCGGRPQLSILEAADSTSGDGSSRRLQCASCLTTWAFRRVVCPSCGEEEERKLGYFEAPAMEHVRIDACESCGRYLKTIDLRRLGVAVPLVDEVAAVPLDIWARERGYEKIELNLVGL